MFFRAKICTSQATLAACIWFASVPSSAAPAGQLTSVGDHRLFLNCSGQGSGPTVILEAGAGATSSNWAKVQSQLETSARVCSYDRAGSGKSDKPLVLLTEDSIVPDLHQLLVNAGVRGPYVLVAHSMGGIYVRAFATRYPHLVQGLVLVDSSHEEQLNRYTAISTGLGERFATQEGRSTYEIAYQTYGQLRPGRTLSWRLDIPLIVIEHKRPGPEGARPMPGQNEEEANKVEAAWHEMQLDLVHRSKYGELREAKGGHLIPDEQPELVSRSVVDVLNRIKALAAKR